MTKKEQKKRIMKDINYIVSNSNSNNILFEVTNLFGENILGEISEDHPIYHWGTIVERILDNDKFDEATWILEEEILKHV